MKYILSGGGTGGHIYPALAIADEIKSRQPQAQILYVGKADSLEEELAGQAGLDFRSIHISGLPRKKLNKDTVITAVNLMRGLSECKKIIKEFKPDVVIGTGGYVCAPIVLKAQQRGIPTVIQEQNAFPGKTNRLLCKKANLVALNFEEAKQYLKNDHIIFTGNPIRRDFFQINRKKAREELGLSDEVFVFSFGGSGGQESTNEAMIELLHAHRQLPFRLVHVTGKEHYEAFMKSLGEVPENVEIFDYTHEAPKYLMAADIVIASSSAMTLAEISAVGIPSILIPKSYTAGNHQVHNANAYAAVGASNILFEDQLTGESLYENILTLVKEEERRKEMAFHAKELGSVQAVKKLVDEITVML